VKGVIAKNVTTAKSKGDQEDRQPMRSKLEKARKKCKEVQAEGTSFNNMEKRGLHPKRL